MAIGVWLLLVIDSSSQTPDLVPLSWPVVVIFITTQTWPLAWRRTRPVAASTVATTSMLIQGMAGTALLVNVVLLAFLYSAAKYASTQVGRYVGLLIIPAAVLVALECVHGGVRQGFENILEIVYITCMLFVAWLLGWAGAQNRRRVVAIEQHTAAVQQATDNEAALAAERARSQIAEAASDIVATGLAQVRKDVHAVLEAGSVTAKECEQIAATARAALQQTRQVVSWLREQSTADSGTPLIPPMPHLIEPAPASLHQPLLGQVQQPPTTLGVPKSPFLLTAVGGSNLRTADWVLAAVIAAVESVSVLSAAPSSSAPVFILPPLLLLMTWCPLLVALVLCRAKRPRLVLLVATVAMIIQPGVHGTSIVVVGIWCFLIFHNAATGRAIWFRTGVLVVVVVGACWAGIVMALLLNSSNMPPQYWFNAGAFWDWTMMLAVLAMLAWTAGAARRATQAVERETELGNEAAVKAQAQAVKLAAQEARLQVARDTHDVVAHGLVVIVVQAEGAAYALDHDPQWTSAQGVAVLQQIQQLAGDAAAGLAASMGPSGQCPSRGFWEGPTGRHGGFRDVLGHVDIAREAGWPVAVQVFPENLFSGDPENTCGRFVGIRGASQSVFQGTGLVLSAAVAEVVRWVVGEALTNVMKHTPRGTAVAVTVQAVATCVVVTVVDQGYPQQVPVPGNGILGMKERAVAVGGEVRAGLAQDGRFTVTATLPLHLQGQQGNVASEPS